MDLSGNMIVKFSATWCGPCKALAPTAHKVALATGVRMVEVDVDENPELAAQFGVRSVPMMVALKDGKPVESLLGNASEAKVQKLFELLGDA